VVLQAAKCTKQRLLQTLTICDCKAMDAKAWAGISDRDGLPLASMTHSLAHTEHSSHASAANVCHLTGQQNQQHESRPSGLSDLPCCPRSIMTATVSPAATFAEQPNSPGMNTCAPLSTASPAFRLINTCLDTDITARHGMHDTARHSTARDTSRDAKICAQLQPHALLALPNKLAHIRSAAGCRLFPTKPRSMHRHASAV
jgi:hypothetical protein